MRYVEDSIGENPWCTGAELPQRFAAITVCQREKFVNVWGEERKMNFVVYDFTPDWLSETMNFFERFLELAILGTIA